MEKKLNMIDEKKKDLQKDVLFPFMVYCMVFSDYCSSAVGKIVFYFSYIR